MRISKKFHAYNLKEEICNKNIMIKLTKGTDVRHDRRTENSSIPLKGTLLAQDLPRFSSVRISNNKLRQINMALL